MRRQRSDANQSAIVESYRARGCTVRVVSQFESYDLLVGSRNITDPVEIKDPAKPLSKRALTPAELELHESWRGSRIWIIETDEDVAAHVQDMHRRALWQANGALEYEAGRI